MKSVILFRHGKSDWNANYNDDYERPLAKRGIKASKIMGQMLSNRNEIPDQIISSTSLRTRTTVELADPGSILAIDIVPSKCLTFVSFVDSWSIGGSAFEFFSKPRPPWMTSILMLFRS